MRARLRITFLASLMPLCLASCVNTSASPEAAQSVPCASLHPIYVDAGYETRMTPAEQRAVLAYDQTRAAVCGK